jgi:inosine/xanthosine triphosphate pyrophosphatase family protein
MILTGKTREEVASESNLAHNKSKVSEMRQYLSDTDWYVVRFAETGKEIPPDVSDTREKYRKSISDILAVFKE